MTAEAREPVWLVRTVLVLFLVGFAAFLGREVQRVVDHGWSASQLGWILGAAAAMALLAGAWAARTLRR